MPRPRRGGAGQVPGFCVRPYRAGAGHLPQRICLVSTNRGRPRDPRASGVRACCWRPTLLSGNTMSDRANRLGARLRLQPLYGDGATILRRFWLSLCTALLSRIVGSINFSRSCFAAIAELALTALLGISTLYYSSYSSPTALVLLSWDLEIKQSAGPEKPCSRRNIPRRRSSVVRAVMTTRAEGSPRVPVD